MNRKSQSKLTTTTIFEVISRFQVPRIFEKHLLATKTGDGATKRETVTVPAPAKPNLELFLKAGVLLQLVLPSRVEKRSRQTSAGGNQPPGNVPRSACRTQPPRVLPQRQGLGGGERVPREALQDQATGQWRVLHRDQPDLPEFAGARHVVYE